MFVTEFVFHMPLDVSKKHLLGQVRQYWKCDIVFVLWHLMLPKTCLCYVSSNPY